MSGGRPQELALPTAALAALHRTLSAELGAERAAAVLRQAGHATGDALAQSLQATAELQQLGTDEFWRRLAQLFAARGWGTLTHIAVHPGVGVLESTDWTEAEAVSPARRPSCFFSTGVLANLLGQAAGAEIAVLEVECRARGDHKCRFLFGGPEALQAIYDQVARGQRADDAVAQLG